MVDFDLVSDRDMYWFIGLFEGEGSMHISGDKAGGLVIQMTDLDVLERVVQKLGGGITESPSRAEHHKKAWRWYLGKHESYALLKKILPELSNRRQLRAQDYFEVYDRTALRIGERDSAKAERNLRMARLRSSGMTFEAIGKIEGMSRQNVMVSIRNMTL